MKIFSLVCLIIYIAINSLTTNPLGDKFILATGILFLIMNICYLYKYRRNQLICFEFLFAIAFFLCSFLTPYIYSLLDNYQGRTFVATDYNTFRVYCIAFIGYCAYMFGLCCIKDGNQNRPGTLWYQYFFNNATCKYSNILCFIFVVLFYLTGGSRLITLYSDVASDLSQRYGAWGEYMTYAMYAYTLSIVINFSKIGPYTASLISFFKNLPFFFYINSLLLVVPLLISGLRSSALQLLIPLIMMYGITIKRISSIKVIALILAGYIFMVFIGLIRSGDTGGDLGQDSLFLTFVYDFVSANGANSFLIDYTDKYGITGGSNMILQTLSIIPFFQSIILSFVSTDNFAPNSSKFFTESFMDSTQGGLGTALIGDIYYSFGIVGVIILMFLIGLLVNKLSRAHNSPYAIALLIMFSGNALFAPRVEYCYILRSLSYTIIFLYIILSVSHNRSASNECSLRN